MGRLRIYLWHFSCRYLMTICFYFNTRKRKWRGFMKILTERFVSSTSCGFVFPMWKTGCSMDPQISQVLSRNASSLPARNPGPVLGVRKQSQRERDALRWADALL